MEERPELSGAACIKISGEKWDTWRTENWLRNCAPVEGELGSGKARVLQSDLSKAVLRGPRSCRVKEGDCSKAEGKKEWVVQINALILTGRDNIWRM